MRDEEKAKAQLISEIVELRKRIDRLKSSSSTHGQTKAVPFQTEKLLSTAINAVDILMFIINADFKIILFNTSLMQWCSELRLDKEVLGRDLFEAFPFLPEWAFDEYQKVFKTGEHLITTEAVKVSDREFVLEIRKTPVVDKGKVSQVITFMKDITKQQSAENELKKTRGFLENIFKTAADMIMLSDPRGYIVSLNEPIKKMLGFTQEELIGKHPAELAITNNKLVKQGLSLKMEERAL